MIGAYLEFSNGQSFFIEQQFKFKKINKQLDSSNTSRLDS